MEQAAIPPQPAAAAGNSFRPSEEQISDLVDQFYARVREDDLIGPVFNENVESWPAHLALLKDFWSSVVLGSGRYKGNPLVAHFPLPMSIPFFNRWLELFEQTAAHVMPPQAAEYIVQRAYGIAANMSRVLIGV